MGIGDWGLGIGDWGLGPIPNPQYPTPQSPIPNPQSPIKKLKLNNLYNINLFKKHYLTNQLHFLIFINNLSSN